MKAPTNTETLLQKHCFTNVSPFVRTGNICCGNIVCIRPSKNVSEPAFRNVLLAQKCFFRANEKLCGGNILRDQFPQQCFLDSGGLLRFSARHIAKSRLAKLSLTYPYDLTILKPQRRYMKGIPFSIKNGT